MSDSVGNIWNDLDLKLLDLKKRFEALDEKYGFENYYLAYSGGKDSHLLFWFIKDYLKDEKITIVGVDTYMEHPQIKKRIYDNSDIVLKPKLTPMEIKRKYGIPCFSKFQDEMIERYQNGSRSKNTMNAITGKDRITFKLNATARELVLMGKLHKVSNKCCKYLKKEPMDCFAKESGKKAIMGVRGKESKTREAKYKTCFTSDKKFTPLHDFDDKTVDEIYKKFNIEIPSVYEHISRTGCMGCPYGSFRGNTKKELDLLPEPQRNMCIKYHKESYDVLGIDYKHRQESLF